jgi:hypothetical protein
MFWNRRNYPVKRKIASLENVLVVSTLTIITISENRSDFQLLQNHLALAHQKGKGRLALTGQEWALLELLANHS